MKKHLVLFLTLALLLPALPGRGADDIVKKGLSFGPLPIVAYDQDKGLQYGALLNIYNFGDGSWYPVPKSQWYLEASFFTKGSMLFTVNYDNRTLIPGVRFCVAGMFQHEKALDFYGFNGYATNYDASLSSAYYRIGRSVPYFKADFTGEILPHFYWKAGYHFKYFAINSFKPDGKTVPTLFDLCLANGTIPADQADGGISSSLRAGLMYDSRDFEAAPSRGIWAELNAEFAPGWLGTSTPYIKYYFALRHYLPLVGDRLVFAYRLNAQGFAWDPAFYMLPYETVLGYGYDRDGFGGYRTIRGIVRDRIQGRSIGYFNTELRYRFIDFHLFNQNVGLALSGFFDGGRVLQAYGGGYPAKEGMHVAAGGGFRFIMNRNFIIAVEYGIPFNAQDRNGTKFGSLYINTGFLF